MLVDRHPDRLRLDDPQGREQSNLTMNALGDSVRATVRIGVVGVFVPQDPTAPHPHTPEGRIAFDMRKYFQKGLTMGTGQCNVKAYNRRLRDLIAEDRARRPSS